MAATTAGALKARIESLGLGLAAHRDRTPVDAALPYVTILEDIALTKDLDGDFGDAASGHSGQELVQVDLWQQYRDPTTNTVTESYTLPDALGRGLHGAHLATSPTHTFGVRVLGRVRVPDPDTNLVHHAYTVAVHRAI